MSVHRHVAAVLVIAMATACAAAAEPQRDAAAEGPPRDASACGSPLGKYDPNRDLGLGEAVPKEPDQPLRRYLYLNMKDSSACPPIGTGDPHGIIVLDIDNGHRFVKRIGSDMMMNGPADVSSGPGVRWMDGSAIADRLYYGYWSPGAQYLKGISPASPVPENANCVIGCIDLRTDETLWEQPTFNACAVTALPDGKRLLAVPHWSQAKYNKMTILDAQTGKVLQTLDADRVCHGSFRSGRYIYPETWGGALHVVDAETLNGVPLEERFGLRALKGWDALPMLEKERDLRATWSNVSCNGAETLMWRQCHPIARWQKYPQMRTGGTIYCDVANGRVAYAPLNEEIVQNAQSPGRSQRIETITMHTGYDQVLSPDERWFYHGPARGDARVTVWDNTVWPPRHVGIMGEGLSSTPQTDPVSGAKICCGNKAGAWMSGDGSIVYTSDSWYFDTRTWKPLGLMRNDKGKVIRCTKMNEVHFRGKDCVFFGQRVGFGRYKDPAKIFPPSADKTPPAAVGDLKAMVGDPAPRWARGAVVVEAKLTWSPATDNEGVQRYAVWRDDELIGNCLGVNPGLDPAMSAEDQADYEKQAGKFEPNTFKARYLEPAKTYRFEIEPIDFAQNRGPRAALHVEVPAVSDEKRMALVTARIEEILARATANAADRKIAVPCASAILELLAVHRLAQAEALAVLNRLAPLAQGDDRDAKALKAKIEAKRKELE